MNYLETLVRLDGAALAEVARARDGREIPPGLGAEARRAVDLIRAELEAVAVLVAVSASVVAAIASGRQGRSLAKSIDTYLPLELALVTHVAAPLLASEPGIELLADVRAFEIRLDLLRRMSRAFAADAREGTPGRSGVAIDILADGWRSLCETAIAVLEATAGLTEVDREHASHLSSLLARAEAGHADCIDADGAISIPGWAERRRHQRFPLAETATLVIGDAIHPVTISDASIGGLGICDAPGLVRVQEVAVRLKDGRRLSGRIAWTRGNQSGLKLEMPLDPADPLLSSGIAV
ncbi:MAG TPA: PilZ domain-containing protein [Hyphomicrobiaceae bacterium]|nr:PilZ domain-containing protein [Hyphomicrobiaceae bacterium]